MIRTGMGRPSVWLVPAHNDMSHFSPSEYEINDWFYMSLDDYMDKTDFERFDMNPDLPKKSVDLLIDKVINKKEDIDYSQSLFDPAIRWHYQLQQHISKSKGMLWQYNVTNKTLDGWLRQCSAIGEKRLRPWSWLDCYVKLPILTFWCRMLNKTLYFKRKKEWAEWDKFLEGVHKK